MAGPEVLLLDAPLAPGGIIRPPMAGPDVLLLDAPLAPGGIIKPPMAAPDGWSLGTGRVGGAEGAAAVPPMAGSALACKLGWAKSENSYFGLLFAVLSPVKTTSKMCGNCCKKLSSPPFSSFTDSSWRQTGGNFLFPCTFDCSKWYHTPGAK